MKKPIAILRYLLSIHITALLILSIFRLILYFSNCGQITDADNRGEFLLTAMLKGIQFDNMIVCYIIALPVVVLLILALCNKIYKPVIKGFNVLFIVAYAVVFAISAADIPYFAYYFSHLDGSIINWLGFGGTMGMVLQESSYYLYFGFFLLFIIGFSFLVTRFSKQLHNTQTSNLNRKDLVLYIPLFIVIWGLCFIGLRGSISRYPLRVSAAYFCDNSFFNQLGINPAFFLLKSAISQKKKKDKLAGIMDVKEAIAYVQQVLNVTPNESDNPISRAVEAEGMPNSANVVVILLESMSTEYLKSEYNGKTLTPFLHQLIDRSYSFDNFYSSGVHTNNGIASTLYGYPPIFEQTMMGVVSDHYTGLPVTLRQNGYETLFFLTHNPQYDNMNSFLSENGFGKIYSQYDYPNDKVVNNFGVQDDFLFEYGLDKLNTTAKNNKPFFATFMTVSNHPPYVVPERFKNAGSTDEERIIAFSDNSLKEFMENASKQDWYKNTIFVILGDHGRTMGKQIYDMPLSYNHIPLILYSPLFEDAPKKYNQFGGQYDIFPTVMGLLNLSYENNSLGTDLFKEQRPYAYFVNDHYLGCIDDKYFYQFNPETKEGKLFDYRNSDAKDLKLEHVAKADSMHTYGVSMMVAADYLIKKQTDRIEEKIEGFMIFYGLSGEELHKRSTNKGN